MTQERESIGNQEVRVGGLRDEIIGKLKARGGDPDARVHQMGIDMIAVASDENRGGTSELILDVSGEWRVKFDMAGDIIANPTILELLRHHASIEDSTFRRLLSSLDFQLIGSLSDDGLAQYLEKQKEDEQRYIEENKPRLLQEFIKNLEGILQTF